MWTGLIRLAIGTGGYSWQWTLGLNRSQKVSRLAERLSASKKLLCCLKLFKKLIGLGRRPVARPQSAQYRKKDACINPCLKPHSNLWSQWSRAYKFNAMALLCVFSFVIKSSKTVLNNIQKHFFHTLWVLIYQKKWWNNLLIQSCFHLNLRIQEISELEFMLFLKAKMPLCLINTSLWWHR